MNFNKTLFPGHINIKLKTGSLGTKKHSRLNYLVFPLPYVAHTHIDMITGLLKYTQISATPMILILYELVTSLLPSVEHFPSKKPDWAVQGQLSVKMEYWMINFFNIKLIFPIAWGNSLDFPTVS